VKLRIVAVGKLKDQGLRVLADEYLMRARRHLDLTEVEVRDDRALLSALTPRDLNGALEVGGDAPSSSRDYAARLQRWLTQGSRVSLFIGGAEGLPAALLVQIQFRLSLSPLTLPHRIARVVLLEQIYRATAIWHGEPYAKED
jgi:23S rRNA (pseudouridine1915-N3)-methyltransferase